MNVQFKKGVLEMCALSLGAGRDRYGYELARAIARRIDIVEGSIYPLLRRLTQQGYFSTYLEESRAGPPRKYYRLTADGRTRMAGLLEDWRAFTAGVERIIREGARDDEASVSGRP